jgi:uncharacterized membrane-anchored protein
MPEFHDVVLLKSRAESDNEEANPYWIILEKGSIILSLFIIGALGIGLKLPVWGVALLVGLSLGPVVYLHMYFIYIRPLRKKQKNQNDKDDSKE